MKPKPSERKRRTPQPFIPYDRFRPSADRRLRKVFSEIGVPRETAFVPDEFQLQAVDLIADNDVLVSAPTGSGKTWIAAQAMKKVTGQGKRVWYASPLKALSNSKYHEFEEQFGQNSVGILTGDRKENTDASIVVGTTEILRNQLYDAMSNSADFKADLIVLDEAHYLGDRDRGVVWEEVMIYLPARVRLLMLSATIPNDVEIAAWLTEIRRHPCRVVRSERRPVPIYPLYLLPSGEIMPLSGTDGITPKIEHFLSRVEHVRFRRSDRTVSYAHVLKALAAFNLLPAIFFLKSRFECNQALHECKKRSIPFEKTQSLQARLEPILREYPFLSGHPQLPSILYHALGAHHGGQLPHWKIVIEKLMNDGLLDAIFSTSTVAAGVDFPARTVVLVQSDRFNGREFVDLSATDLHQAIGRAGRRGKDKIGFAVMVHGPFQNPRLIDTLLEQEPDPIESQIKINFSMILNLLLSQKPEEIHKLIDLSLAAYQKMDTQRDLETHYGAIVRKLHHKIKGGNCHDFNEALQRISNRREMSRKLARLKKKRKRLGKVYYKQLPDIDTSDYLSPLTINIDQLAEQLKQLPCNGCSHFALCHRGKSSNFTRNLVNAQTIAAELESSRHQLWNEFRRHLDFLVLNDFAREDGTLTSDGIWASKLRLDQPLIIAELIRKGMLSELSPELLAGIIAVFVTDKHRDITLDSSVQWDKRLMVSKYYVMKREVDPLITLKKEHHFSVPLLQFWPAAALFAWAGGMDWDQVIRLAAIDEGDLAMMIFRTADNLRQITSLEATHTELAEKARTSIQLILREPAIIPV